LTISRTDLSLATLYSNFMEQTCNREYRLIHVDREDRTFCSNMLLFIFNGKLLEHARSKGINPDIEGDLKYYGFHQDDVDRYGYYFLFLRNFPQYANKIWVSKNAEYMHLKPIKEKRKKDRDLAAEAEEEIEDEENLPGAPRTAGNEQVKGQWKDINKYTFDMPDLGQLMRINLKLSVKHVTKTIPNLNKCEPTECDALPWEGMEKH
jgi:hypothetical protein